MSGSGFDFDDFQFDEVIDEHISKTEAKEEENSDYQRETEGKEMSRTFKVGIDDDDVYDRKNDYSDDFSDEDSNENGKVNRSFSDNRNYNGGRQSVRSTDISGNYGGESKQLYYTKQHSFTNNGNCNDRSISTKSNHMKKNLSRTTEINGHVGKKDTVVYGRARVGCVRKGVAKPKPAAKGTKIINCVLSASRLKAQLLHNTIFELQKQVEILSIEKKDLKRTTHKQERELKKLDNAEAELPSLLKKHSTEMKLLQEKFKRQKEVADNATEILKRRNEELSKLKDKLRKYEELMKETSIVQKVNLTKKQEQLEKDIGEKDKKIEELRKIKQYNEKSLLRERKDKKEKYRKAVEELKLLQSEHEELKRKLKIKEKALEVSNIYSQRINLRRGSKKSQQVFSVNDPLPPVMKTFYDEQHSEYSESSHHSFYREQSNFAERLDVSELESTSIRNSSEKMEEESSFHSASQKTPCENENARSLNKEKDFTHSDLRNDAFYDSITDEITEEGEKLEEIDKKLIELKNREDEKFKRERIEKQLGSDIANMWNERLGNKELLRQMEEETDSTNENICESHQENKRDKDLIQNRCESHQDIENERDKELEVERKNYYEGLQHHNESQETDIDYLTHESEVNLKEDEEKRSKKQLLIAKIKAIDRGQNPNEDNNLMLHLYSHINPKENPRNHQKPRRSKPMFLRSKDNDNERENDSGFDFVLKQNPFDFSKPSNQVENWQKNKISKLEYQDSLDSDKHQPVNRRNTEISVPSGKSNRSNTWSFKLTDENLHKGLPSNSELLDSPKLNGNDKKDSDDWQSNKHCRRQPKCLTSSGNKRNSGFKLPDHDFRNEDTLSPLTNSPVLATNKKKQHNDYHKVFEEFDDPYRLGKTKIFNPQAKNTPVFSSDENEVDSWGYQPSKPTAKISMSQKNSMRSSRSLNDDDLEEMILT